MGFFPHLFSPMKIGGLQLRNRLCMAPTAMNYSTEKGGMTQRQIDYYTERARGGVGLIISESNYVSPEGRNAANRLGLYADDMIPHHRRLVDALHRENTPILAQLHHGGRYAPMSVIGQYPVSSSATPLLTRGQNYVGVVPRALTLPEIEGLVERYSSAASRAMRADFDGILLHAAHGYLFHQFLSSRINRRTDPYGGSDENRARFLLETVRGIKKVIGPEKPLTVRLNGMERVDGGFQVDFICRVARWLEEAGVDSINVSAGGSEEAEWSSAPRSYPEGHNVPLAAQVKAAVGIPVSVAGRIKRPELADRIVAEGQVDQVWMARALIADPHFPRKAQEGRTEDIRECIACNLCSVRCRAGDDVQCTINPEAGAEAEMRLSPAERPRRVLVVGGGPAGMEAARAAAARGHRVTLAEKQYRLGGQLLYAAAAPNSVEMDRLARQMARQVEAAGAVVLMGIEVRPAMVEELGAEVVVVATGASPVVPPLPGSALPNVFTAHQLLGGRVDDRLGRRVAVIGGGLTGVAAAEYLLEREHEVIILEMLDSILADGNPIEKRTSTQALGDRGVPILVNARAEAITGRGVMVGRPGEREVVPADSVVIAVGVRSDRELLAQLDVEQLEVHLIGDAASPRRIRDAMVEAARVGRLL